MKIVIDTKEDIHILRHVINLLHAVSTATGSKKYYDNHDSGSSLNNLFSETTPSTSTSSSSITPETSTAMFSMFDTPTTSSSSTSTSDSFNSLFGQEPKKDEDKKDFLDTLQVY